MELCRLLEIRKTRTTPGNPHCNGLTERFNKTLVRMIKAYLKGEQTNWDRYLGCLAGAYRATIQESTGLTPNLLMLGREVRLPAEVMFGSVDSEFDLKSYGEYVDGLRKRMQQAHDVARKNLEAAAQRLYFDFIECFTTTFLRAHSWLNWVVQPRGRRSVMMPMFG